MIMVMNSLCLSRYPITSSFLFIILFIIILYPLTSSNTASFVYCILSFSTTSTSPSPPAYLFNIFISSTFYNHYCKILQMYVFMNFILEIIHRCLLVRSVRFISKACFVNVILLLNFFCSFFVICYQNF